MSGVTIGEDRTEEKTERRRVRGGAPDTYDGPFEPSAE